MIIDFLSFQCASKCGVRATSKIMMTLNYILPTTILNILSNNNGSTLMTALYVRCGVFYNRWCALININTFQCNNKRVRGDVTRRLIGLLENAIECEKVTGEQEKEEEKL